MCENGRKSYQVSGQVTTTFYIPTFRNESSRLVGDLNTIWYRVGRGKIGKKSFSHRLGIKK